ncbi:hypothetical protein UPYG_G00116810 [Umbra pygmaea]|uniref:Uncharacterized protein n=1 Tax=Umbra pygmaea TaxID=75934 RepID=A0ABD0X410_UMBPY
MQAERTVTGLDKTDLGGLRVPGEVEWVLLEYGWTTRRGESWRTTDLLENLWEIDSPEVGGPLDCSCCSIAPDMNLVLLAFRLMCLALLWPVTLLNGNYRPNKRRHKDAYLGENAKNKHGG